MFSIKYWLKICLLLYHRLFFSLYIHTQHIEIGNGSINNNAVSRKIAHSHEYLIISVRVKAIYISRVESFNSSLQKSLSNKSNIGNAALAFHFPRDVSYHLTPNHNYVRDIPTEIEVFLEQDSDLLKRICSQRKVVFLLFIEFDL